MRCDNKELLQPHFPNSETHASPRSAMAQMIFTSQLISPKTVLPQTDDGT